MKWHSLDEIIPSRDIPFLVTDGKSITCAKRVSTNLITGDEWEPCEVSAYEGGLVELDIIITHWMPLPHLPKKK